MSQPAAGATRRQPHNLKRILFVAGAILAGSGAATAVELKPETIEAFDQYITSVEMRLAPRFRGERFLWFDDSPAVAQKLQRGAVVAQPVAGDGVVPVKNGLIEDWIGAVFVPNTNLRRTLSAVQDYDHHREAYKPDIVDTKLESREGDNFLVYLRIIKSKFLITGVFNTEHEIRFTNIDSTRAYSTSFSKRIAEVSNAGRPTEHELKVGQDRGLMWRLDGFWFFEERDGGVYIACESITLTRDVPALLMKLLGPVIHEVPGEALRSSLDQTRNAILAR